LSCGVVSDVSSLDDPVDGRKYPYQRIPRTSTQANAVVGNTQAADTVLVTHERANLLSTSNVPNLGNVSDEQPAHELVRLTLHSKSS